MSEPNSRSWLSSLTSYAVPLLGGIGGGLLANSLFGAEGGIIATLIGGGMGALLATAAKHWIAPETPQVQPPTVVAGGNGITRQVDAPGTAFDLHVQTNKEKAAELSALFKNTKPDGPSGTTVPRVIPASTVAGRS